MHVHGFGISGSYLMPTARLLTDRGANLVPDLPGYGRSERWDHTLGIPALAHTLLDILDALGFEKVILVGNSMGAVISLEVAHAAPGARAPARARLPRRRRRTTSRSPRALMQLATDGVRESPKMARVAVPDYLKFGPINTLNLLGELTRFPSLERLLEVPVPSLAVIGSKDPLMPAPSRVREVGTSAPDHVTVVLIEGAAHAINFSHPGELAHVITSWLDDKEIVDDPDQPGLTRVLRLPRG